MTYYNIFAINWESHFTFNYYHKWALACTTWVKEEVTIWLYILAFALDASFYYCMAIINLICSCHDFHVLLVFIFVSRAGTLLPELFCFVWGWGARYIHRSYVWVKLWFWWSMNWIQNWLFVDIFVKTSSHGKSVQLVFNWCHWTLHR